MSDVPPSPDSTGDRATRAPRWVYVAGVIAAALVLAFVILHLAGFHGGHAAGGEHTGHPTGSGHVP